MHVNLVPRLVWGDVDLTESPFMLLMDPDFSQGENLYEVLETELFDGSSVSSESTDNRTPTFRVAIIDEVDQEGLALAGARLDREAEKARNLLTFDPGDGFGTPWSVETYRAQTRVERLDDLEQSMIRIYEIEMQAAPHVRSVAPVVIPATGSGDPTPPPAPVVVTVDDCTSTTGWTAWDQIGVGVISFAAEGDHLRLTSTVPSEYPDAPLWPTMRRSGLSVDMASTPLLRIESTRTVSTFAPTVLINGVSVKPIATDGRLSYFSFSGVLNTLEISSLSAGGPGAETIRVYDVSAVSSMPFAGTARQLFRSFETHGTARTSGTLRLSHANALGSVLVWSGVDGGTGYQPPMRGYKSGGGGDVADTAAASGARTDISASPFAVTAPVSQLPPGLYRVAARVRSDTTGTAYFTRTYTTLGSPLTPLPVTTTVTPAHNLTSTYRIVDLGTEMISGSYGSAMERMMAVQATGTGTGVVWLDELYLLNTSTGAVVQVEAGACTKLWINAPTVDAPFPTMLGGTQADGSDAVRLDTVADIFQPAAWPPGMINLFTVCGQPNLAAEAEYYPRFLHNAYGVAA